MTAKVMARIVGRAAQSVSPLSGSVPLLIAVASAAGTVVVLSAGGGVGERVYSWVVATKVDFPETGTRTRA